MITVFDRVNAQVRAKTLQSIYSVDAQLIGRAISHRHVV